MLILKIVDHVLDRPLKEPGAVGEIVENLTGITTGAFAIQHQGVAARTGVIAQRDSLFLTLAAEDVLRPNQSLIAGKANGGEEKVNSRLQESSQRL